MRRSYLSFRVLVSEIKSPDAGAGTDVEYPADSCALLARRRNTKLVIVHEKPQGMSQV